MDSPVVKVLMQKLETGMYNKQGFTLIEILVVLVIIGITVGFAMLAFGDFGAERSVLFAAEQLVHDIKTAQQQAILEIGTYGIRVNQHSYQVFRFDSEHWQQFRSKKLYQIHLLPKNVTLEFQPKIDSEGNPQIVINESGEMNRFNLYIYMKKKVVAHIVGHHSGLIQLNTKPSS